MRHLFPMPTQDTNCRGCANRFTSPISVIMVKANRCLIPLQQVSALTGSAAQRQKIPATFKLSDQSLQCWMTVVIQDLTRVLIQRATMIAHVIDIDPDINYVLFHRRLRFALMVFQPLRYPSAMIALGAGGGVYILYTSYSTIVVRQRKMTGSACRSSRILFNSLSRCCSLCGTGNANSRLDAPRCYCRNLSGVGGRQGGWLCELTWQRLGLPRWNRWTGPGRR